MAPMVMRIGLTAAIPVKPCQGVIRAGDQRLSENVQSFFMHGKQQVVWGTEKSILEPGSSSQRSYDEWWVRFEMWSDGQGSFKKV